MRTRTGWHALVWVGAYLAAAGALLGLGRLEWMTVDWADPSGWLSTTEVEVALAALGRLAGLALLAWIGLTTAVYAAARLLGVEAGSMDWLSFGPVRRAIDGLLAGYLLVGSIAPAGAAVDAPIDPPPVVAGQTSEAVDPQYVPVPAGSPSTAEDEVEEEAETDGEPFQPQRVVVEPGDHLWKLASDRLTEAWGRSPTEEEIAAYWRKVVEANRDRIRSGDPDLIFPDEEIVLPPLR